jgi:hypothetical protein
MARKQVERASDIYPDAVPLSKAITGDLPSEVVLSTENCHMECYMGYKPSTIAGSDFFYNLSVVHKHSGSVEEGRLVSLSNGALQWAFNPLDSFTERYYIPSIHVSLPRKINPRFGIYTNEEENDELTREFFGLTFDDLQTLIRAYEHAAGHTSTGSARITCSLKQNTCDLTGALIPREFPYLTFAGSDFIWSHISLSGFYTHVAFLAMSGSESPFYRRLLAVGCEPALIDRVRSIVLNYRAIVSREVAC